MTRNVCILIRPHSILHSITSARNDHLVGTSLKPMPNQQKLQKTLCKNNHKRQNQRLPDENVASHAGLLPFQVVEKKNKQKQKTTKMQKKKTKSGFRRRKISSLRLTVSSRGKNQSRIYLSFSSYMWNNNHLRIDPNPEASKANWWASASPLTKSSSSAESGRSMDGLFSRFPSLRHCFMAVHRTVSGWRQPFCINGFSDITFRWNI